MKPRFGIEEEGRLRPFRVRTLFLYNTDLRVGDIYALMDRYNATQIYIDSDTLFDFETLYKLTQDYMITIQINSLRLPLFFSLQQYRLDIHWVYVVSDLSADHILNAQNRIISIKVEGKSTMRVFNLDHGVFTDKDIDYKDDIDNLEV